MYPCLHRFLDFCFYIYLVFTVTSHFYCEHSSWALGHKYLKLIFVDICVHGQPLVTISIQNSAQNPQTWWFHSTDIWRWYWYNLDSQVIKSVDLKLLSVDLLTSYTFIILSNATQAFLNVQFYYTTIFILLRWAFVMYTLYLLWL